MSLKIKDGYISRPVRFAVTMRKMNYVCALVLVCLHLKLLDIKMVRIKICVVTDCLRTSKNSPDKLFFSVPPGDVRNQWDHVLGRRNLLNSLYSFIAVKIILR